MKIYVLGSTTFVKDMVAAVDKLKNVGHDGWIHPHYVDYVHHQDLPHVRRNFAHYAKGEAAAVKIENDYLRQHYAGILASDAIFIVNLEKNGIANYIGGNVLMEMGQAHVNNKKIFLLNPIPAMPYKDEIIAVSPIVINGDYSKIL
jgi:hypothetical protein